LEDSSLALAQYTALGAAVAFELSIGVFTYRIIKGSRRRWTRRGLWFFIVASVVANGYYYRWLPVAFDAIMPVFATLALPLALALFAEEFGAEVKLAERRAKRNESTTETTTAMSEDAKAVQRAASRSKKSQVRRLAAAHPEWSRARLAQEIGCSASTVTRALAHRPKELVT